MTYSQKSVDRAILLLNLGGPETLNEVKPFLYRLFEDPEIIRIKFSPLRKLVAWLISTTREKKSQALYKQIGGGSPIRQYTDSQAARVEKLLTEQGRPAYVKTAFTCSPPLVEDVVKNLKEVGVKKVLSFPMFPQYSYTTTRGSLNRVKSAVSKTMPEAQLVEIRSWAKHPLFLKAHAELVDNTLKEFSDPKSGSTTLLFSAHSIPEKLVTKEGDPYKDQIEDTCRGIVAETGWKGDWELAWQSKLGPVQWLGPSTADVIKKLGKAGVKQVLIVPVAFVSDHIETLCEIDIEFARLAQESGIREFKKTPGLNTHPTFIQALVEIAKSKTEFWN